MKEPEKEHIFEYTANANKYVSSFSKRRDMKFSRKKKNKCF